MDQRYGTEVWNGSFKEVWNGGMERGYGTGVVPELVPDLLFWLAPIWSNEAKQISASRHPDPTVLLELLDQGTSGSNRIRLSFPKALERRVIVDLREAKLTMGKIFLNMSHLWMRCFLTLWFSLIFHIYLSLCQCIYPVSCSIMISSQIIWLNCDHSRWK